MFQTGSGRLYTVKRSWSIDPYGNSHKDHLQDGHEEKQRPHEPVPLVERHAHHPAVQRTGRGPEHVGKPVAEHIRQHRSLPADAHKVCHRSHDGHGDGRLAGGTGDKEIDNILNHHHPDGGDILALPAEKRRKIIHNGVGDLRILHHQQNPPRKAHHQHG